MQIVEQLQKGQDFDQLKPVTVVFVNWKNPQSTAFKVDACFREYPTYVSYTNLVRIIELNLNNYDNIRKNDRVKERLKMFAAIRYNGEDNFDVDNFFPNADADMKKIEKKIHKVFNSMKTDAELIQIVNRHIQDFGYIEKEGIPMSFLKEERVKGMIEIGVDAGWTDEQIAQKAKVTVEEIRRLRAEIEEKNDK